MEAFTVVSWSINDLRAYQDRRQRAAAKLECGLGDAPLCQGEAAPPDPQRRHVSIISFRRRLIDSDNLCPKFHVDGLRLAGIIADDSAKHIILEVSQQKVRTRAEECTMIEII